MRRNWRIINTDNFGSDYPDERFVEPIPPLSKEEAEAVCKILNGDDVMASRYFKAVERGYKLLPGFEP